jgi:hypothetical protein
MLKLPITYEDYDGKSVTEEFYFNMSKIEWLRFQAEFHGGFEDVIKKLVEAEDLKQIMAEFEKLVLLTYGERDGNKFLKNDDIVQGFKSTAAYHQFIWELATDEEKAAAFINGVMPKDLEQEAQRLEAQAKTKSELEQAAAGKTLPETKNVFEGTATPTPQNPSLTLPPQPPQPPSS